MFDPLLFCWLFWLKPNRTILPSQPLKRYIVLQWSRCGLITFFEKGHRQINIFIVVFWTTIDLLFPKVDKKFMLLHWLFQVIYWSPLINSLSGTFDLDKWTKYMVVLYSRVVDNCVALLTWQGLVCVYWWWLWWGLILTFYSKDKFPYWQANDSCGPLYHLSHTKYQNTLLFVRCNMMYIIV